MTEALDTFNDILNRHLRPWMVNYSPQKYQQELATIKKETYQFQPLYDLAFPNPLSEKRKYYHTLIENAAKTFLNSLHDEMESAPNDNAKAYYLNKVLDKQLNSKLREVSSLIERKNYQFANITRTNDDAYIIQYLKYQLVRLYLEVQDSYLDELKDEPLTQEETLSRFFSEPPFEEPVIVPEERKLVPDRKISTAPKQPRSKFVQRNHEIRDPEEDEDILLYDEIVDKPDALGRIEEILFDNKYIDQDLKFIKGRGKQLVIAAVAHVLKQKKFFKKIAFHDGNRITVDDRQIQRFISHRYKKKIDQQYRRFKKEEVLTAYLKDNIWIRDIASA